MNYELSITPLPPPNRKHLKYLKHALAFLMIKM